MSSIRGGWSCRGWVGGGVGRREGSCSRGETAADVSCMLGCVGWGCVSLCSESGGVVEKGPITSQKFRAVLRTRRSSVYL